MKKLYLLFFTLILTSLSYAQGSEDFADSNAGSSYATSSFTNSTSGITWDYVASRDGNNDANNSGINLPALMLRRSDEPSKITSSTISGGIGDFSVKLYKGFTGGGNRQVELFINGVSEGTSVAFDDYDEHIFSVSGINTAGDIIIEIVNITPKQVIIDDITWTGFSTSCGAILGAASYTCTSNTVGDGNDTVTVEIPYTGVDAGITSVTSGAQGATVGGDDPATVTDGTITITGLVEGEAWDITLNGGDCDGFMADGTIPAAECDPIPNTCYDLSAGPEQFEAVEVIQNSDGDNWTFSSGTYNMNGYCGSGCSEPIETWLILGPLDMTGVTDLSLILDAATQYGDNTALNVQYTSSYSGCPSGTTWTSAGSISSAGNHNIDLSAASGTDVFIGVQYADSDNFTSWSLSNVELASFGNCPVLGTPPVSDCGTCDLTLETETYTCLANTVGDTNDGVTVEIPYTGLEDTIVSLTTTIQGVTIGGDDPATISDGTISLSGLFEGDIWDLTINGGDCDGTTVSGTIPTAYCDPVSTNNVGITGNVDGVYINEIHYDNIDGDVNEFVEIAGPADTDLSDYTISLYNGNDGELYGSNDTFPLSGTIDNEGSGVGAIVITFPANGLQNGGPDGIALSKSGSNDIQFLTYEGVITNAGDGPAVGLTSEDIGVSESGSTTTVGSSLEYDEASMSWVVISDDTPGDFAQGTLSNGDFDIAKFSVFPNPTSIGYVNIISNSSDAIKAQVFDILGKQVINSTVSNNRLNVSNLNAGIYIVKLTQDNASVTKKLVIK